MVVAAGPAVVVVAAAAAAAAAIAAAEIACSFPHGIQENLDPIPVVVVPRGQPTTDSAGLLG